MPPLHHAPDDQRIDAIIGAILRAGVVLAATVVLLGGVLYLARHGAAQPSYHIFRGEPSDLRHLASIAADARALKSRGLMQLGLVLLIATPIVRVAVTCIAFALQRDATYVLVTMIVLGLLLYSLIGNA